MKPNNNHWHGDVPSPSPTARAIKVALLSLSAAAVSVATTSAYAQSQTDANASARSGEEPKVMPTIRAVEAEEEVAGRSSTGTKSDTPIMEVPQSISVITREDMEARNVRDVGEAVSYTAGIFSGSQGETTLFGGNAVKIRGFGGNGTAGASSNEYLDGLRLRGTNYINSNLDPYLFERVEVLKGPASVLFGQTQPGGVVNAISKRPTLDRVNEVRLGFDNHSSLEAALDLGGALGESWFLRVTGLGLDGETQQDHSDRKRQLLAPALTWTGERTSLTVLGHYQHDDINATLLNALPAAAVFSNPNGSIDSSFRVGDPNFERWDSKMWSFGYLFSHSLNDSLTLRQNLRYSRYDLDSRWLYRRTLGSDRRTLSRSAFTADEQAKSVTLDNQAQWEFATGLVNHTLLFGVDYYRHSDDTLRRSGSTGVPSIDLFAPVYNQTIPMPAVYQNNDVRERQLGYYVQDQLKLNALSLLVGGRYDDARTSSHDRLDESAPVETQNYHAFTSRVGAIYNFANGWAPYASYAESFEPVSGTAFDGTPFDPKEGKQYEVGLKYQPLGTQYLFTLALFDLTQKNMTTSDADNPGWSVQTGEVRTLGVEFESKASFENGLDLTAAYTYLDDEVTESNDADLGKRRPQIPEHSASLWADYTVRSGALSGLGLGLGVRRTGSTQGDSGNTFSVPGYTLIDLALRYDLEGPADLNGWKVAVNASNLFDKDYVASCNGERTCYIGLSRSVRATVQYNW